MQIFATAMQFTFTLMQITLALIQITLTVIQITLTIFWQTSSSQSFRVEYQRSTNFAHPSPAKSRFWPPAEHVLEHFGLFEAR